VHGVGTGPVERVSNLHKIVGGMFIAAGQVYTVGEGTNIFGAVRSLDATDDVVLNDAKTS
jgi:hypothetical protein